ncbi:MAG: diphthine synthase [Acidilobaceae archaeon]|nr:diphthine synthase [Acidilobaceae archaeon]
MLVLAGYGLSARGVTRELEEELERADVIYAEQYTMPSAAWLEEAVRKYGSKAVLASRSALEESSRKVVEEARSKRVVILTAGDPLIATSHLALLAEAAEAGVEFKYLPAASGVCAAKAFSGLNYYRFGRTATVPGPWKGFKPYSIAAYIYGNLCVDLHTLLLLDVSDEGRQLSPAEAAAAVLEAEEALERELSYVGLLRLLPALVIERAGMEGARLRPYDSLQRLSLSREAFAEPSSIAVPAPLNRVEVWLASALSGRRLEGWASRLAPREDMCVLYSRIMGWLSS